MYCGEHHLDMILLPRILNRLKDVPGAAASHLQPRHILTVPALDEQRRPHRYTERQQERDGQRDRETDRDGQASRRRE